MNLSKLKSNPSRKSVIGFLSLSLLSAAVYLVVA